MAVRVDLAGPNATGLDMPSGERYNAVNGHITVERSDHVALMREAGLHVVGSDTFGFTRAAGRVCDHCGRAQFAALAAVGDQCGWCKVGRFQ